MSRIGRVGELQGQLALWLARDVVSRILKECYDAWMNVQSGEAVDDPLIVVSLLGFRLRLMVLGSESTLGSKGGPGTASATSPATMNAYLR